MARNIEIKARVENVERLRSRILAISDTEAKTIYQEDVFFECNHGRLKLRKFPDGTGELIQYDRPNRNGPKESNYIITPASHPGPLEESLARSNGVRGVVRKRRLLFLVGRTRVHLDNVEGLGDFVELEVVLDEGDTIQDGERIALGIMDALEIDPATLVEDAYLDLLNRAGT